MLEQHNKFILTADLHFIATNVSIKQVLKFALNMPQS